ncbi:MAG TPA: c-type cytochrome [Devosia sp.]|nr:c-type cytochrome [Devosia sp.]
MTVQLRHLLMAFGLATVLGVGIVWGGAINVGASTGHWPITDWFLHFAMRQSVAAQSAGIETPPLDAPGQVRRGAAHFEIACAICHGSPAAEQATEILGMTPPPPLLMEVVGDWTPRELFWIVKHGVKFTGMPAWPSQERDDEVWAMVAFLRRMPEMTAADYRALALGGERTADAPVPGLDPAIAGKCFRCHGSDGAGFTDEAFPKLDLQTPQYLFAALLAFRDGTRASGIMQAATSGLSDTELRALAEYFGSDPVSLPLSGAAGARGEQIAMLGLPAQRIGACAGCHDGRSNDIARVDFPRLAGQYESYLAAQLGLFADPRVKRGGGRFSSLMRNSVHDLSAEDIAAVSAWYAARLPERK